MKYVCILAGGAIGSLIRFWMSEFILTKFQTAFPTGIFIVNISGAFFIGFLFGLLAVDGHLSDTVRFLLFVGFLGGFTTFSSFALENMILIKNGFLSTSIVYVFLTNIIGVGLSFAGYFTGLKLK